MLLLIPAFNKTEPIKLETKPPTAWDLEGYEKIGPNEWVGHIENMRVHLKRVENGWLVDAEMLVGIPVLDYEKNNGTT